MKKEKTTKDIIRRALVWLKIVNKIGIDEDGYLLVKGLNRKNPLSYLIILIIVVTFIAYYTFLAMKLIAMAIKDLLIGAKGMAYEIVETIKYIY